MANNTDWLNISSLSGNTGITNLTLTALTNSSLSSKTAIITARNSTYNVSDTSVVTIEGFVPTLTLSRSTLRFDSTGGTATFTVYSNTAWTISYPSLVYNYSTSAGTGDTEVTIVLAPNLDEVSKVDVGTVQDTYNVNQLYLTIVQESFIVELEVIPDSDIEFINTGSSSSVVIDCNADWEIVCPNWITPSVASGSSGTTTVTFTAGQNGNTDRSGAILIYAGSKEVTINAFQPFYIPPRLSVTPTYWEFPYTEAGKTFVVDSYPEWTAEIISTGETVWASDTYMEATFVIPSAMTMPLYTSSGNTTGIYLGPVKIYGSSVTFESTGTYKIRYEVTSGGTVPSLSGNTYLTNLYFTENIGSLQTGAFSGCSSLTGIVSDSVIAPGVAADTFYGVATGGTLHYPDGSDYSSWLSLNTNYLGYYNWNNAVQAAIDNGQLLNLATITYNVTSSSSSTKILSNSYYIFAAKEGNKVTVLYGWDSTGYTFSSTGKQSLDFYVVPYISTGENKHYLQIESCTSITDLVLKELPTLSVPQYVAIRASGSTNITAMTLNQQTNYSGTFWKNLVKYEIGGNVTQPIVSSVGYKMTALTEVVISSTALTALPGYSFYGATNLSSVTITTNSLTSFGDHCFSGCTGLRQLNIPSSIIAIGEYCFANSGIESIAIPDSVSIIPVQCFIAAYSLTNVVIGSGVTSIGTNCFSNATSLSSITISAVTAPSLGTNPFSSVASAGTLYYPAGSDYSSWLSNGYGKLGYYGWTGVEI